MTKRGPYKRAPVYNCGALKKHFTELLTQVAPRPNRTDFMKRNKAYEFAMVLIDNLYNHHHARTVLVGKLHHRLHGGYICHAN